MREKISSLVTHIGYPSEDVKEAVGYINMEFQGRAPCWQYKSKEHQQMDRI